MKALGSVNVGSVMAPINLREVFINELQKWEGFSSS